MIECPQCHAHLDLELPNHAKQITDAAPSASNGERLDGAPGYASSSHARLMLYELMNSRRPWAHSKNVYDWMEEIMDMAEQAFTGRRRPTHAEYDEQTKTILRLTEPLKDHPDWHEGACACEECPQDA